jgi:general secretion pathway protein G
MNTFFQTIKRDQRGFTLVELLIVVAVIAILGTVAVFALTRSQRAARDTTVVYDLNQMQTALEYYYTENGRYPEVVADGFWSDSTKPGLAKELHKQLDALPQPPRDGQQYVYMVNKKGTSYYLQAELEDPKHASLTTDIDGTVGGPGWAEILSDDTVNTTDPQLNCDDSQKAYCVSSGS